MSLHSLNKEEIIYLSDNIYIEVVKFLIEKGAYIGAKNNIGKKTFYSFLCEGKSKEEIDFFLKDIEESNSW